MFEEVCRKTKLLWSVLRHKNRRCNVSNIKSAFQSFLCPSCAAFFDRSACMGRKLSGCSERVEHVHPKNIYQIWKIFHDRLGFFGDKYRRSRLHSKILLFLTSNKVSCRKRASGTLIQHDWLENAFPPQSRFRQTWSTDQIFWNTDPQHLVIFFNTALQKLVIHSEQQQKKTSLLNIETALKTKLTEILETLSQRHNMGQSITEVQAKRLE